MTITRPRFTPPVEITDTYRRYEQLLLDDIAAANAEFDITPPITYGYVGNCDINGGNDSRSWMVFLPHPGRVGQDLDRLGGYPTGHLPGVISARRDLACLLQGIRFTARLGVRMTVPIT